MGFQKLILPKCPKCNEPRLQTIEPVKGEKSTRRRRKCQACGHRVTTHEVSVDFFEQAKKSMLFMDQVKRLFEGKLSLVHTQPECISIGCKCNSCQFNIKGKFCNFELPEYDTDDSFDCNHYQPQQEAA